MSTSNLDYAAPRQGCVPLAQLPAYSANAWRQSWSVHISASAHARSSWSRTISNRFTDMYMGALVIFLLNELFKDLFQAIA